VRVLELWRHPVKSLLGERVDSAELREDGLAGDRAWGILDLATGRILTGRREPRLLFASAKLDPDGGPRIVLPDGETLAGRGSATDGALTRWLGRPVSLVASAESAALRAEYFADSTDDSSEAIEWTMPKGRFVDALPVLVITTAGLRAGRAAYPAGEWDFRRFRPNVVVEADGEAWVEDSWCGRTLRLGDAIVAPRQPCMRCTMVTRAQPELVKDVEIFRTLWKTHGATAGVWSSVVKPGTLRVGAAAVVADHETQ
jgi:uncharacterized protein YcbX